MEQAKFYTVLESYKNGELVKTISMKDLECITDISKNIQSQLDGSLKGMIKVVNNENEIIVVSKNPNYDLNIYRYIKY